MVSKYSTKNKQMPLSVFHEMTKAEMTKAKSRLSVALVLG